MRWEVVEDYDELSQRAAHLLLQAVRDDPRVVFGLPTGRTPEGMYAEVVRQCSREYHCFRDASTFNLDEYVGIPPEHPGSYCTYMRQHLFDHIDLPRASIHIPDGTASLVRDEQPKISLDAALGIECHNYERDIRAAGGLGVTFLGLGQNGHIGFNEPGASFKARTRVVELSASTRRVNAALFPDGNVPQRAITMGIATILDSARIVILASGESKRHAVERLHSSEPTTEFPATAVKLHDDVVVLVDRAAAGDAV